MIMRTGTRGRAVTRPAGWKAGWRTRAGGLAAVVALLASGCAGGDAEAYSASLQAGTYAGEAAPLPTIARVRWEAAQPGCEGRLLDVQSFGVAEGQPELIVALSSGELACVDTYSAVESELVELGSGRVDGLWLGYVATLQDMEVLDAPDVPGQTRSTRLSPQSAQQAGSPPQATPQAGAVIANRRGQVEGDPDPAPNITGLAGRSFLDLVAGDPDPAPNEPDEGSSPTGNNASGGMTGMNASHTRD